MERSIQNQWIYSKQMPATHANQSNENWHRWSCTYTTHYNLEPKTSKKQGFPFNDAQPKIRHTNCLEQLARFTDDR